MTMKSKDLADGRYIGCPKCDDWYLSSDPIVADEPDLCSNQICRGGHGGFMSACWYPQQVRWSIDGSLYSEDDLFSMAKELIYHGEDQ
jgi:hypothetical protein